MKLIATVLALFTAAAFADQVVINPGESVYIGYTEVTCRASGRGPGRGPGRPNPNPGYYLKIYRNSGCEEIMLITTLSGPSTPAQCRAYDQSLGAGQYVASARTSDGMCHEFGFTTVENTCLRYGM